MSFWDVSKKGFLPTEYPRLFLTNKNLAAMSSVYQLEILSHSLPQYQAKGILVSAIKEKLGNITGWETILNTEMPGDLERLQLLLSLFSQAAYSSCQTTLSEVDIPLREVNYTLGYRLYFYYLVNWNRVANAPVVFDKIKHMHLSTGKECEAIAIRFHVALETLAANSIKRIDQLATMSFFQEEEIDFEVTLRRLIEDLALMTDLSRDKEWSFDSSSLAKYAFDSLIEPKSRISLCRLLTPFLPAEHSEFFRKLAKSGLRMDLLARKYGLMFLFKDLEYQYQLFCSAYNQ